MMAIGIDRSKIDVELELGFKMDLPSNAADFGRDRIEILTLKAADKRKLGSQIRGENGSAFFVIGIWQIGLA